HYRVVADTNARGSHPFFRPRATHLRSVRSRVGRRARIAPLRGDARACHGGAVVLARAPPPATAVAHRRRSAGSHPADRAPRGMVRAASVGGTAALSHPGRHALGLPRAICDGALAIALRTSYPRLAAGPRGNRRI